MKKFLNVFAIIVILLVALIGYWMLRPNESNVDENVIKDVKHLINDDMHNSNTDMVSFRGILYAAYVSSPFHFASDESVLHVMRSTDRIDWEEVVTFNLAIEDIRDPKLTVIGNRIFLYALKNTNFIAEPYMTVYSYTEFIETPDPFDKNLWTDWTAFEEIPDLDGWLFWRPKSQDGEIFYNAAYWYEHGESILIKSMDGINWTKVSTINTGEKNDETAIEFLPDGSMIATARLEYGEFLDGAFGDKRGGTLITVSEPPYTDWTEMTQDLQTRLDGPCLFSYNDRTYAVGRYQPDLGSSGPLTDMGSVVSRKRTSLFEVTLDGLIYLTDFPSAGDTSYCGLVKWVERALVIYYSSRIDLDYPWIAGMLSPSQIMWAEIDLVEMEKLADEVGAE